MRTEAPQVSVIIAAWNAEATIGRAITSALVQREVSEVIVVNDSSIDATAEVVRTADDGSGRLRIITFMENRGPAAARNAGLAASNAPYVALLDADDFFLPERFRALFAIPSWDAIADNVGFISSDEVTSFSPSAITAFDDAPHALTLSAFVSGNISRPGRSRGELGFAKPVMRRAYLDAANLRYDETLRLGEDYALYARMIARGATFLTVRRCGYIAVERASSLSGRHRTADLAALLASDRALERDENLSPATLAIVRRHRRQLEGKVRHRIFLDTKRGAGMIPAVLYAAAAPSLLPALILGILRDKTGRPRARTGGIRYLF